MVNASAWAGRSGVTNQGELLDPTATEHVDADAESEQPGHYFLLVSHASALETYPLEPGAEVIIGRGEGATVRVDEKRISRRHARIFRHGNSVFVEDLQSRNGTRLNGRVIGNREFLGGGDRVQVGSVDAVLAVVRQVQRVEGGLPTPPELDNIVVADREMRRVFSVCQRLGQSTTAVLILGETGVGKEVVAHAIHRGGPRRRAPLVHLNCAATPDNLLESELFGYEHGAFTGADRQKLGYVESANGGTLFLDEIGEMPPALQAKLLKFLEDGTICRLGSVRPIALDVRVIAATHRPLEADIASGRFRQDLYYRLAGFTLHVPPLRERPSEVLPLAQMFLRNLAEREQRRPPVLSSAVALAFQKHSWPGNVRELRNAVSHALVLAETQVELMHLPPSLAKFQSGAALPKAELNVQLEALEQATLAQALAEESGNRTRAARRLGISRRALIYKIEKFGL